MVLRLGWRCFFLRQMEFPMTKQSWKLWMVRWLSRRLYVREMIFWSHHIARNFSWKCEHASECSWGWSQLFIQRKLLSFFPWIQVQVVEIVTHIKNPPKGTKKYEQAGLFFGSTEDSYLKVQESTCFRLLIRPSSSWSIQEMVLAFSSYLRDSDLLDAPGLIF